MECPALWKALYMQPFKAFYIYSCTGHFLHTVSFHSLEGESPPPRSTPWGAYRSTISYKAVPLYCLAFQCSIHSHTHSWQIEVWWLDMFQWTTCVLLCVPVIKTWHCTTSPLTSWVALCEPLVCSYDISHSRAQQASITSLAASSMA